MELGSLWASRPVHGYILTGNPEGLLHTIELPPPAIAHALTPTDPDQVTCFSANQAYPALWWLPIQYGDQPWRDPVPAWSRCLALLPSFSTWIAGSPWDGMDPASPPPWWAEWRELITGWTHVRSLRIHWVHPTTIPWLVSADHVAGSYWRRTWLEEPPRPVFPAPQKVATPRRKKGSPSPVPQEP